MNDTLIHAFISILIFIWLCISLSVHPTSIIGVKNIKKMNLESFEAVLDELSANMDDGDDDEDVEGMESEDIDDIDSNQS